jgi:hypothetical protein
VTKAGELVFKSPAQSSAAFEGDWVSKVSKVFDTEPAFEPTIKLYEPLSIPEPSK